MPVHVTETAAREIDNIIQQQDLDPGAIRLRVGVKGGGCSGFSYLLDLTEVEKETDESWDFTHTRNGKSENEAEESGEGDSGSSFTVRVICDPKSYLYLNGTEIDFKDEIMGRGFVFNNPNATTTCG
ncbi:MAG: iron-sulfur cluster assembly accessory protein, partial [Phycisphaerales bacterium]|nr:iron-sulfur cluster assembly accessory protein [Phycisphaerales bacterium]